MLSLFYIKRVTSNPIIFIESSTYSLLSSKQQLKQGDIVSFKHRGYWLSNQTPKSASIYRIRSDLTWDHVLHSYQHRSSKSSSPTTCSLFLLFIIYFIDFFFQYSWSFEITHQKLRLERNMNWVWMYIYSINYFSFF